MNRREFLKGIAVAAVALLIPKSVQAEVEARTIMPLPEPGLRVLGEDGAYEEKDLLFGPQDLEDQLLVDPDESSGVAFGLYPVPSLADHKWHHMAYVWNGLYKDAYIDGVQVGLHEFPALPIHVIADLGSICWWVDSEGSYHLVTADIGRGKDE